MSSRKPRPNGIGAGNTGKNTETAKAARTPKSSETNKTSKASKTSKTRESSKGSKVDLVRFGVAMEAPLLGDLDSLVDARGGTRSEVLRDLVRAEVTRSQARSQAPALGTLTLVYDHHVRDLSERLTEMQHALGERVRSTLHVHLDEHTCLEVIIMFGRADELQGIAERALATKGVKQGGLELVLDAVWKHIHPHHHTSVTRHRA